MTSELAKRIFHSTIYLCCGLSVALTGCKGNQIGHILKPNDQDMVGSHSAGSSTFNPLVDESVHKLLHAAESNSVSSNEHGLAQPINICFVGIENRSAEELGDFKEQLIEKIDTLINNHPLFNSINRNYVDAGLQLTRLRPEELYLPENLRIYAGVMEERGQPIQYMLHAKLTSGTTQKNANQQRDYLLTLSLVDITTGQQVKQSAEVRKGYHRNPIAKALNYNPFKRQR